MTPLDMLRAYVAAKAEAVTAASTPSEAFAALDELEAATRKARTRLAVRLVLDDGWSYAEVGRAARVTRQAASKTFGPAVREQMHRTIRRNPAVETVRVVQVVTEPAAQEAEPQPRGVDRDQGEAAPVSVPQQTTGPVVVIPCGGAKLATPAPAGEMYTGSYHRACRRAADRLGGRLLILSARYGLVDPSTTIEPYELRMGDRGSVDVATLRDQARSLGVDQADAVTVLAGREYADAATAVWPHARRLLDGTRGMPEQMALLARLAGTQTDAPPTPAHGIEQRAREGFTRYPALVDSITGARVVGTSAVERSTGNIRDLAAIVYPSPDQLDQLAKAPAVPAGTPCFGIILAYGKALAVGVFAQADDARVWWQQPFNRLRIDNQASFVVRAVEDQEVTTDQPTPAPGAPTIQQ